LYLGKTTWQSGDHSHDDGKSDGKWQDMAEMWWEEPLCQEDRISGDAVGSDLQMGVRRYCSLLFICKPTWKRAI
jgi:hypothetical protein